jgi:DNA repair protein RecN (Recombination protein N)
MLAELNVRHFATVDQLLLSPATGLTVITGETGAGKSILIDALALALGHRGDSDQVRAGCKRAEFSAEFRLDDNPAAMAWLEDHQFDEDDLCQLRRTIGVDGRSRAWINGRACSLQEVRSLADCLISIHSQHEHQLLLQKDHQRNLLDDFAGAGNLAKQVANAWKTWRGAHATYQAALDRANASNEQEALLRFQLQELDALALQEGELASLESEQKRLAHAGQLIQLCQQTLTLLCESEEGALDSLVSQAEQMMRQASAQDGSLIQVAEAIESARLQLEAGADDLRHYLDRLEQDPERLALVEARLDSIFSLARKLRVRPEALCEHHQTLRASAAELIDIDSRLEQLEAEENQAKTAYLEAAEMLSQQRRCKAKELAKEALEHMRQLGMPGAKLEVALDSMEPSAKGLEQIEFRFSANPGQPLKPLAKVASGGELSRVSLAIQVVCAKHLVLPCLVFDEVDVGVGGGIAEIVGALLKNLSHHTQILCITHQPQVASQGHQHWRVLKQLKKDTTLTSIEPLQEQDRVEEIARMLGGVELTAASRQHAQEMLQQGQKASLEEAIR